MDIANLVRALCPHDVSGYCDCTAQQAANEIERLRKELDEWRTACEQKHELLQPTKDAMQEYQRQVLGLQRDLTRYRAVMEQAVEALEIARNGLVQWHVPENRYAALNAIAAVLPAPTFKDGMTKADDDHFLRRTSGLDDPVPNLKPEDDAGIRYVE